MLKYRELSRAKISETKDVVISECLKNGERYGYTVAQQVEIEDDGKKMNVFLKGAIRVNDLDYLYNLRDAVLNAIDEIEEEPED
jgi:uncharacterized protein YabE (DUF348 family)